MATTAPQAAQMSADESALCSGRNNYVDYAARDAMHYLGNYERIIPASLTRMMENAHDWEHLPFVHASSFAAIDCLEQGLWGWRARLHLPQEKGGGTQLLDLIADNERHYWVSTVFYGMGEGIEIHTQASQYDDGHIKVDIGFYLPEPPATDEMATMVLSYMQTQYATLYDEDQALMQGRQAALDARKAKISSADRQTSWKCKISDLDPQTSHDIMLGGKRFCLRFYQGAWVVHAAICPHMLGPLNGDEALNNKGELTCPWHGYRFDLDSGECIKGACGSLPTPPVLSMDKAFLHLTLPV